MRKLQAILMGVLVLMLLGCQSKATTNTATTQSTTQTDKIDVVTSFYPVYYMTKTIAGDKANVSMLLDGNVDAHDFEPSAKDIATIDRAKLFVYSSDEMETWAKKVSDGLGENKKVTFVKSGKDVTLINGEDNHDHSHHHESDDHKDEYDPHIWLEPETAKTQVNTIAQALIEADFQNKETYEKNRDMLLNQLDALAKEYQNVLGHAKQKVFATQHAAFGYIAHKYGLEQLAVSGLSAKEPTAKEIATIVKEIKAHNLSVIYVDPTTSHATANTVAKEVNGSVEHLYTMESPVDNMDYLQILKANLESLKKSIK